MLFRSASIPLKLYVYGYLNRVHSSRRLEAEANRNLEVMWLLQRLAPDFKTIADFRKSERFEMDNHTDALLRSLKRHGTEYSDLLIRGPETQTVCRLVLDRFSATLYSSSPATFAEIEQALHQGSAMADAIESVAFRTGAPVAQARRA